MFKNLRVMVLELKRDYHHQKADECLEKKENSSDKYEAEEWHMKYLFHARQEYECDEAIFEIKGI
jgi:hypothetical protein